MATARLAFGMLFLGLAVGFAVGRFVVPRDAEGPTIVSTPEPSEAPVRPPPPPPPSPPSPPNVASPEPVPAPRLESAPAVPAPPGARSVAAPGVEDRLRLALGADATPDVVARAKELRDRTVAGAEAAGIAQAAREELERRDVRKVEAAGAIARVLDEMADKHVSMPEIAADGTRMATLLRPPARGPTLSHTDLGELATAAEGTTIRLGAGTFAWPPSRTLAAALTVEGVGIDKTLVGGDLQGLSGSLVAFTAQDLTLTGQDVFDAQGKLLTLTLRRVRAVGFNSGAGGSAFMDVRGGVRVAILAQDCTFDGEGPGGHRHGTVFELPSAASLLRFEGCTFVGVDRIVRDDAAAHFVRCTFRDDEHAHVAGAVYEDCVFEGNADDAT